MGVGGIALAGAFWGRSAFLLGRTYDIDVHVPVATEHQVDAARGEHLLTDVLACAACHGDDLGGAWVAEQSLLGRRWAPNLTTGEGGVGPAMTLLDWTRAVRHGIDREGHALVAMPSRRWAGLSDADLLDVVAAIEARPPVDRSGPERAVGMGVTLAVAMGTGLDVQLSGVDGDGPTWSPDPEYGAYLAEVAGCVSCHERDESRPLGVLEAPGFEMLAGWTGAAFARAVREGIGRDGRRLDPWMPSAAFAGLDDTELDALWWSLRPDPLEGDADGAASLAEKP